MSSIVVIGLCTHLEHLISVRGWKGGQSAENPADDRTQSKKTTWFCYESALLALRIYGRLARFGGQ